MTLVTAFLLYAAIVACWTWRQWTIYRLKTRHTRARRKAEARLARFDRRLAMSPTWVERQRRDCSRIEYHGPAIAWPIQRERPR